MSSPSPADRTADELPWRSILDQAGGPMVLLDLEGAFVYVNPAAAGTLGYTPEQMLRLSPSDVTHPDDVPVDGAVIRGLIESPTDRFEVEKRYLCADGSVVWKLVTSTIIRDRRGAPRFVLSQTHNVSAWRESELRWQRTVANAPIGMALLNLDGRWTEVNDKLCELLGYRRDELLAMHAADLTYPDDTDEGLRLLADLLEGRIESASVEQRYRHRDGHPLWMLIRTSVVPGIDDKPACLVSQYEQIGGDVMQDSHLAHMALHDPLTGLANRALLMDRLTHELAELHHRGGVLAVLLLDLDDLKPVNDEFGHHAGDQMLITTANVLLNTVRSGDTVARFGGDEFVVVSALGCMEEAEDMRDRVSDRLDTDIVTGGNRIRLGASVGLATTRDPAMTTDSLLHEADRDMYRRKRAARR